MAALVPQQGASASPNSSEEVDSYQDTPATKVSPFSSQETQSQLKPVGVGFSRSKLPPQFLLFSPTKKLGNLHSIRPQDPFVSGFDSLSTTQVPTDASKLSPNASTFTPTTFVESGSSDAATHDRKGQPSASAAHDGGVQVSQQYALAVGPSAGSPFFKMGMFSSEIGTSRCVEIAQLAGSPSPHDINEVFNLNAFPSRTHLFIAKLDKVYLKFADIRDAEKAITLANTLHRKWKARFLLVTEFASEASTEHQSSTRVSVHEGQVVVTATFAQTPKHIDVDATGKFISELVSGYGNVMAFEVRPGQLLEVSYHMEFCDLRAAGKALGDLNELKFDAFTLNITPYTSYHDVATQYPLESAASTMIARDHSFEKAFGNMALDNKTDNEHQTPYTSPYSPLPFQSPAGSPFHFRKHPHGLYPPSSLSNLSPGSFDHSPSWSPSYNPFSSFPQPSTLWTTFSPGAIGQERGTPLLTRTHQDRYGQQKRSQVQTCRRFNDNISGHHNVVDIDRIRQGTDIMLRNIPNKIDQAMLKEIVDETSFSKYDFMYLRIDFANNCNVGYAFINFEDPYHIIEFVTMRAGQRWNRYNSDKVAEVSYATIQGRDCLIQKFRNSSVMLEHVSFRPKIFHTTGLRAGQEDSFPGPDNPSKMRRSVENAAHVGELQMTGRNYGNADIQVGLFAPRAGQSFRDEQRRRRSQYDRGTRLAEIEDAFEDENHLYQYTSFSAGNHYGGINTPFYPGLPAFESPI
ncbi:hypothetical protein ACLMJK_001496 [Lecanora helva]